MYSELESHSPEHIDAFFAALRPVFDVCVAEHECLYFDIVQDPEQPGTICWVENVDGLVGSVTNVSSRLHVCTCETRDARANGVESAVNHKS